MFVMLDNQSFDQSFVHSAQPTTKLHQLAITMSDKK